MQDLHNNANDHYITRMSVSAKCKLFITQSHGTAWKVWRPREMHCCLTGRQLHAARPLWAHMDGVQVMSCRCGIYMSIWRWGKFIILWLMLIDWSSKDKKLLRGTIEDMGGNVIYCKYSWHTAASRRCYSSLILESALTQWDWLHCTEATPELQGIMVMPALTTQDTSVQDLNKAHLKWEKFIKRC